MLDIRSGNLANIGWSMKILLELNVFFNDDIIFQENLPDIRTSIDGTFAGLASYFMKSVLSPAVILKTELYWPNIIFGGRIKVAKGTKPCSLSYGTP